MVRLTISGLMKIKFGADAEVASIKFPSYFKIVEIVMINCVGESSGCLQSPP